jgi:hypothetical protein
MNYKVAIKRPDWNKDGSDDYLDRVFSEFEEAVEFIQCNQGMAWINGKPYTRPSPRKAMDSWEVQNEIFNSIFGAVK